MKIIFRNINRMKKFMESYIGSITDKDFNDWLEYLKDCVNYIEEDIPEQYNSNIVKKANLTFEGEVYDYEVYVDFINLIDNGELTCLIDLDYTQGIEEI